MNVAILVENFDLLEVSPSLGEVLLRSCDGFCRLNVISDYVDVRSIAHFNIGPPQIVVELPIIVLSVSVISGKERPQSRLDGAGAYSHIYVLLFDFLFVFDSDPMRLNEVLIYCVYLRVVSALNGGLYRVRVLSK